MEVLTAGVVSTSTTRLELSASSDWRSASCTGALEVVSGVGSMGSAVARLELDFLPFDALLEEDVGGVGAASGAGLGLGELLVAFAPALAAFLAAPRVTGGLAVTDLV